MRNKVALVAVGGVLLLLVLGLAIHPNSAWQGVDTAVVGRFAAELGRPGSAPLLNVQGDMLLFVFAIGGAAAGFVLGYNWRTLFGEDWAANSRRPEMEKRDV